MEGQLALNFDFEIYSGLHTLQIGRLLSRQKLWKFPNCVDPILLWREALEIIRCVDLHRRSSPSAPLKDLTQTQLQLFADDSMRRQRQQTRELVSRSGDGEGEECLRCVI